MVETVLSYYKTSPKKRLQVWLASQVVFAEEPVRGCPALRACRDELLVTQAFLRLKELMFVT